MNAAVEIFLSSRSDLLLECGESMKWLCGERDDNLEISYKVVMGQV